jgi:hypothetical protein
MGNFAQARRRGRGDGCLILCADGAAQGLLFSAMSIAT